MLEKGNTIRKERLNHFDDKHFYKKLKNRSVVSRKKRESCFEEGEQKEFDVLIDHLHIKVTEMLELEQAVYDKKELQKH